MASTGGPSLKAQRLLTRSCPSVKSSDGGESVVLTGVGIVGDDSLLAHSDPTLSYTARPYGMDIHFLNYFIKTWSLGFHDACWELFLAQLSTLVAPSLRESDRIGQHLFQILHCLPTDDHGHIIPTHEFGGAHQLRKSPTRIPSDWQYVLADPTLEYFAPSRPSHQRPVAYSLLFRQQASLSKSQDLFSKLPQELVVLIIEELSSEDLCNLRIASKSLARVTFLDMLPQSFWQSRFLPDKEMGFLCVELQSDSSSHCFNWHKLYFDVKEELLNTSLTGHLRNRRRIWQSLRHATDCLVPLLQQRLPLIRMDSLTPSLQSMGYIMGHVVRGRKRVREDTTGYRLLRNDYILFDSHDSDLMFDIRVSYIDFDCTRYVCGLRLMRHDSTGLGVEMSRVGLVLPASERSVKCLQTHKLSGVKVASSVCGIVGLVFLFKGVTETTHPAGAIHEPNGGEGVATLRPQHGRTVAGLAIGFDVRALICMTWIDSHSSSRPAK
jgi:hypothetical protein